MDSKRLMVILVIVVVFLGVVGYFFRDSTYFSPQTSRAIPCYGSGVDFLNTLKIGPVNCWLNTVPGGYDENGVFRYWYRSCDKAVGSTCSDCEARYILTDEPVEGGYDENILIEDYLVYCKCIGPEFNAAHL
jgi:hypothetical protein